MNRLTRISLFSSLFLSACATNVTPAGKINYLGSQFSDAQLAELSAKYNRPIIVMLGRTYLPDAACISPRYLQAVAEKRKLYSDSESRELAGDGTLRDLQGDAASRRLAGDTNARDLEGDLSTRKIGGDSISRALGGYASDRNLGGDSSGRDLDGDAISRGLGGDSANRTLGGDAEARRLGGDQQQRSLEGSAEARKISSDVSAIQCIIDPNGFKLSRMSADIFYYYFGSFKPKNGVIDWLNLAN